MVRAKYSDGRLRDVTRWVRFGSSDEGVASVDDSGHVKMNGSGEAAITLWYASRVLYARLGVPYANKVDPDVYTKFERHNYIDDLVLAKLKALNIAPSGPASRRHVHPPRVSGCGRHSADFRRGRGFSGRPVRGQARQADRPPARARRVRRLLGV